ncbi:MAG: 2-phosphosulfolactate phosphatase [Flavobacteriales bacterium]|nr:2-phosphosulfolactate phosphatase [Flavobacteriales bacterium]
MNRSVEVILSPALRHLTDLEGKLVVVIDILRATTTICAALHNGARSVEPVAELEQALEAIEAGKLVGGERNGIKVDGFHFGNSPQEYTAEHILDKDIVLSTTNGTRCIEMSQGATLILAGAFVNKRVLTDFLLSRTESIVLFCAGWKDQVNLEDSLFAGKILEILQGECAVEGDAAQMLLRWVSNDHAECAEILQRANHVERFRRLGVDDLNYCLQEDLHPVVPILRGGKLEIYRTSFI